MYGLTRLDGLTSASSIFSIWRARDVACRDFDAFAEKRLTNDCKSAICAFFFAFSASSRSRACVAAIGGGCLAPIAAYHDGTTLTALVADPDGAWVERRTGDDPAALAAELAALAA